MRIGILTLPRHINYGGILQAYALQTVLERMGHNIVVLGCTRPTLFPLWRRLLHYVKRIAKNILGKKCGIFDVQRYARDYPILSQRIQPFIDKYIHEVAVKDLRRLNESDFDAIVVGSDQIWRPKYYRNIENAYLDFTTAWRVKRLAYAASFGTEDWEYTAKQTKRCGRLLHQFDGISVREASGVRLCQENFGVDALHVLDPTMLLDKADYVNLIKDAGISRDGIGNLLCYVLDQKEEISNLISQLSAEKNLIPFFTNVVDERNWRIPVEKRIKLSVEQWLRGFYDAEFVVTDSFHGCVFSILFNKPFVVVANKSRGLSRVESLLGMFGLEQCLYSEEWRCDVINAIDWDSVNAKLEEWRNMSFDFLNLIKQEK